MITIRSAQLRDLPAIGEIMRASPEAAHWSRAQWQQAISADIALVAAAGPAGPEELQGFLVARRAGPEWELQNIAVAPESRRQQIAQKLLQNLLQQAQVAAAEAVFLEVRASNLAARALYQAAGFRQYAVRRQYYAGPPDDAILYRIGLAPRVENPPSAAPECH